MQGSASLPAEIDLTIISHPRYQSISLSEEGKDGGSDSGNGLSIDGISLRALGRGGDLNRNSLSDLLIGDSSQSTVVVLWIQEGTRGFVLHGNIKVQEN